MTIESTAARRSSKGQRRAQSTRPSESRGSDAVPALVVPKGTRHRTKQEFVYRTLQDAIMKGELSPGERLVIDDLARRLEVSAIPVREALQLLQSEGLVLNVPHVGATVAPVSRESILEVFTVLEGLELMATRFATERATTEDWELLSELVEAMDQAVRRTQFEDWADLNTRFHLAISRITALPMLQEMTERVFRRWDRVRRYYFSGVLVHRVELAQQEHHAILSAMKAGDLATLEQTIRQHNQGALRSYLTFLEQKVSLEETPAQAAQA